MDQINESAGRQEFAADLVEIVCERLPGVLSLEDLAEHAGCSPRTIQRHFKNARTSYKALVDQARFRKALQRVIGTNDSLTMIAMDLMYGDLSCFTRAFRRWTGMPPSEYRKIVRATPPMRGHHPPYYSAASGPTRSV